MQACILLLSSVVSGGNDSVCKEIGIALTASARVAGRTVDDAVALTEIGVTLPATVANFKFKGKKDFPQKSLGYSVAYDGPMCSVTLFVYNFDIASIPDGKASDIVKDQLKRSINDLKAAESRGIYKNVKEMEVQLPKAVFDAFDTAGYTFDLKGSNGCKSYILLTARNNHFVKVRITQFAADNRASDAAVVEFLSTLAKKITAAK